VLAPPQSNSVVGSLFPAAAAYYKVTFTGNTNQSSYHPTITLTGPVGEFVMDITSNCSTNVSTAPPLSCNTSGDSSGSAHITTWESYYAPPPAPDTFPQNTNIPLPGNNGTVYIKVYRTGALSSANCNDSFTLTVHN
jgi:hypothetical protein